MNVKANTLTLLLVVTLLFAACNASNSNGTVEQAGANLEANAPVDEAEPEDEATSSDAPEAASGDDDVAAWLQRLNSGAAEPVRIVDGELRWGLGYFLYYGSLDSIRAVGIDNMIYHTLEVHRRLDTGELTEETLSQNARNLLTIAAGLEYDSVSPLTDQVSQTGEIRQAILDHVVESQQDLSPQEALDSNNVIGVFGSTTPGAIGGKYLVYFQESPGAEFTFLGVILAVDTAGAGSVGTFSNEEWDDLAWLGDAAGPFWDDLPAGNSGDPTNTGEAKPGVLLISEGRYNALTAED